MTRPPRPLGIRLTAYVVWGALLFGVGVFAVVASFVGPGLRGAGPGAPRVLADVSIVVAVVGVLASRLVPARLRPPPAGDPEAFALSRNIVAAALCEGAGMFGLVAWMLTGSPRALAAAAVAVAGLIACFPGDARWRGLAAGAAQRTSGGPGRMVR